MSEKEPGTGSNKPAPAEQMLCADTEMMIGGNKIHLRLEVPTREVPPESLVPALRQLCNQIVSNVAENARNNGDEISCKAGCGACCRQYVPVSPAEARLLSQLVEDMPEPRRSTVKARFAQAVLDLKHSDIADDALNYGRMNEDDRMEMVKAYFHLGIPCPFLENESCSIYEDRPLICREYIVISSPDHCATLDGDQIKRLQLPVSVAKTFSSMEGARRVGLNPCLPLTLSLIWDKFDPDDPELLPGPNWVQYFFEDLSGAEIPSPENKQ